MSAYRDIEYLIHQLISGSEEAWSHLITQYGGLIYYCINRVLNNRASKEEREDCFQEILRALIEDDYRRLKQIHTFEEKSFRSWLGSVANRLTLNHIRGKMKAFPCPEEVLELLPDPSAPPDTDALKGQIMGLIEDKLPEMERLVVLFFLDGLTLEEISHIMDVKLRRVFSMKQRAISELKILMGQGEKVLE